MRNAELIWSAIKEEHRRRREEAEERALELREQANRYQNPDLGELDIMESENY